MAWLDLYEKQVRLLIEILPFVAAEKDLALKGGTAINLFVRDLPRLSVDIDLTWLPVGDRPAALKGINAGMNRIADAIADAPAGLRVFRSVLRTEGVATKLVVGRGDVQVKIEVTPVLRGCAYPPETRAVSEAVEDRFGFAETLVVSFSDLFAGKIVAALDRQHPRDLFDVRGLLANEGIDDDLRAAFVVYLLGHGRPMHEVLDPRRKDIAAEFAQAFQGMTAEPAPLDDLLATREAIIATITGGMPRAHRDFLTGFLEGTPDWALLGVPGAEALPAILWRQQNLDTLDAGRRAALVHSLKAVLA
ncbi:MAG: nucleotidyl transferase AbiEii/AbiGii toxin family protein [Phenylobacterium sp.]|uniref:nucleotidyl transferase AbiEii/AbiGii toxin family protein n=1 Tax=Phenylobacterium sp. TaxID=1871053 RepID=UPI002734058E|nr:nucleotidyl transferase AbiEii/AbiGii toxin family protein [Phenylobacterium sp.]MDP3749844.1 nucleotidyl transferase AbiEii/AbiGii toxin family protein [Phenylobacterium sp.]